MGEGKQGREAGRRLSCGGRGGWRGVTFCEFCGWVDHRHRSVGKFIYVENMQAMKKSVAMCGKVGRFNPRLKLVRKSGPWRNLESLASN